jgi:probable phosphoglycerate mutase
MQSSCRVLAIRHGQTAWNAEQRLQGHTDIALDTTGQWQAQQVAQALAGERLSAIYSSDLQRALHTAQALAQATGAAVHASAQLRERHFGFLEGCTFAEIEQRWPQDARWRRQRDVLARPGGGESLLQFSNRCVGAAMQLVARHPGGVVALVAHGGVLDCLYRAATGLGLQAPRSWELGNATINRLLWTPQGLSLVGWNDDQHLLQMQQPPGLD